MNKHISVKGNVEGVGFRSFVYEMATRLNLHGWVCSTNNGVEILVQGTTSNIELFIRILKTEAPSRAKIDDISITDSSTDIDYPTFELRDLGNPEGIDPSVFADIGICSACEQELFDPRSRRYLYPFLSCSHCGPRFTILNNIPYDRPKTTMAEFGMCEQCVKEYADPADRHFQAHAIACPDCGPFVALREVHSQFPESASKISSIECRTAAILKARRLIREGYILGIKGLGGFQLLCDASNSFTVEELRDRKERLDKPFILIAADLDVVRSICEVSKEEVALLTSREKPVVLLAKKQESTRKISRWIAPNLDMLGVMLPDTPLHHLLLNQTDLILTSEPVPPLLAMTGGNIAIEPVAIDNEDALYKLSALADAFLLHNREIFMGCEDSVVRVDHGQSTIDHEPDSMANRLSSIVYLRRGRGYAPYGVQLPFSMKPTLAVGAEMNNTICLAREQCAFLSHPIGDLKNTEAFESFEHSVDHFSHIFHVRPEKVAHDLHPDYFSTQYAQCLHMPGIGVQHHHAHIVSCMADNGLTDRQVIGLSFDDSGYGTDGVLWGGEVLLASFGTFERFAHLEYLPLPGGDSAILHPWRIAVGYAHALGIEIEDLHFLKNIGKPAINVIQQQVDKRIDSLHTSSLSCLFAALASLIGLRNEVTYEAQAAIELEGLAKPFIAVAQPYPFEIDGERIIRLRNLLQAIVQDVRSAKSIEIIAARFHRTIADVALDACIQARESTGLNEVALSGSLWQNQILLNLVREGLRRNGFTLYFHQQVPANDSGLSLGQAVIANYAHAGAES